jgi:hypothetical protein
MNNPVKVTKGLGTVAAVLSANNRWEYEDVVVHAPKVGVEPMQCRSVQSAGSCE